MLDTYIIEELKRRERDRLQRERQRPVISIPIERDDSEERDERPVDREDTPGSAVVHIEL